MSDKPVIAAAAPDKANQSIAQHEGTMPNPTETPAEITTSTADLEPGDGLDRTKGQITDAKMSDTPVVANAAPDEANQSMAQHEPNAIPASLTQDDKKGSTATTQEIANMVDYIHSDFTRFENGIVETVRQSIPALENAMVERFNQSVTTFEKEMAVRLSQDAFTRLEKTMVEKLTQSMTGFEKETKKKVQDIIDRRNSTLLQMRQGLEKKLDNAPSSTHTEIGDQQTEMQELASDGQNMTEHSIADMDKQYTEALQLSTFVTELIRRLGREQDVIQRVIGIIQNSSKEAKERMDALESRQGERDDMESSEPTE
ncbi:hypothetical protein FPOA_03432 [Fusarium poae]|uniref:Uncharacterized protein n=1 Tax=Fusarium poae TaxID=36050 RepID=A0A1B8B9T9_FUSPO|nr:hypothetical protein FPOA_03432 [Fusarium poae]